MQADLRELPLSVETFGTKFDVVLIDPPWEEYGRRAPGIIDFQSWAWQEIMALEIERITDPPSFVFLWSDSLPTKSCIPHHQQLNFLGFLMTAVL